MASSGPKGLDSVKRTWCGPTASTPSTGVKKMRMGSLFLAIEQAGEGEDDVLGGERLAVVEDGVVDQVEEPGPSFSCFQDFARPGTNWPASST